MSTLLRLSKLESCERSIFTSYRRIHVPFQWAFLTCTNRLMMVTGFLQYLDKQAIQYSVLYKLEPDLHMSTKQFSWANSLFYFGFRFWQYPSLLLLQRFPVSKYFSAQVLA